MGPDGGLLTSGRAAVLLTALVAAGGCGPGEDGEPGGAGDSGTAEAAAPAPTPPTGPAPTDAPREATPRALPPMEVTGLATDTVVLRSEGPTLQFLPDAITARSGTLLLVRYENGGELPHNFALFRRDEVIDGLVYEAYESEATGYIPVSGADDLIAYSPLVSPGRTAEMEFVVPEPGEYTFICLFPGHAQMMIGVLTAIE